MNLAKNAPYRRNHWRFTPEDDFWATVSFPYTSRPTDLELIAIINHAARLKGYLFPRSTLPAGTLEWIGGGINHAVLPGDPRFPVRHGGWRTQGKWWREFIIPAIRTVPPFKGWATSAPSMWGQWKEFASAYMDNPRPARVPLKVVTLNLHASAVQPSHHLLNDRRGVPFYRADLVFVDIDGWKSSVWHVDEVRREALREFNAAHGLARVRLPAWSKIIHVRKLTTLREYHKNTFVIPQSPDEPNP